MSKEKEISEEYASSLADLTVNSKPLINMLTILAEENIEHAGVIVDTVEKHLEKVHADIKLPVLYLVDSIIKNVGGAYGQKFSQNIVNMFTKTFKQVDEKVRSQMFKLRETWHEVFPSTKLYQLDVKVNLIDPAWPIQAQPQQANIHVNPNFLKKTTPAPSSSTLTGDEERMRTILAKKEQELLMLQRKKVEMELEQTRRQLQMAEKTAKKLGPATSDMLATPVAMVTPVVPTPPADLAPPVSVKQRLGPPVNKAGGAGRIAPVSGALATARRDPRLARRPPPPPAATPAPLAPPASAALPIVPPIAPNVFDIKPLERVIKRKNVITIDVHNDIREPKRRDPRLDRRKGRPKRVENEQKESKPVEAYLSQLPNPKKITKLPPIPKISRNDVKEAAPISAKRKKDASREKKKRKDSRDSSKDSSSSSPEKKQKNKDKKFKLKEKMEIDEKPAEPEVVAFKELKNYHKERYMRRNKEKSESPERPEEKVPEKVPEESPNIPEVIVESKDIDLRVLHPVITEQAAPVAQKRPSTESLEGKVKKNKLERFDILFGNEDVDLRQLPQVEEVNGPQPAPVLNNVINDTQIDDEDEFKESTPVGSPKKDWNEVKEKESAKKTPSQLDLVRAKLAEATRSKDRLGRPLLFTKSPSVEKERRRTISTDETEQRTESGDDFDAEDHKKTISIIMSQAKEQYNDGQLDKNQYNTLMYQVLQLNEKLKLKEAKQRESLEISKRKLNAHIQEENLKVPSPKSSPTERNRFGDIDERITPSVYADIAPENKIYHQDSDMRVNHHGDEVEGERKALLPIPPMMPRYPNMGPFHMWRGPRPRMDEFGPRRFRGPVPPYFRGNFDNRIPRPPFDPRMPMPPLPAPKLGMLQGESPLTPYERTSTPPPLGTQGYEIPPTDYRIIEYIDQDPVKTIQIDGIPREIRFYGETAVIMLDWDDPREINFLPGCRRVTFDNKDSVVLSFAEGYKQVEIDDQVFDIRFGAPTRELYINGRWYECFFGGQPVGVIIDGKPHLVHLEGPLPQVDIGKVKRTDLVSGKINLIVNATTVCPVYLDAKVQKFQVNGQFFTIRFVDALQTVLINEQPFKVEYGDLPKPILVNGEKYFVRFSALPKYIKPGHVEIANMEGTVSKVSKPAIENNTVPMETDIEPQDRPQKSPSPDNENKGLDMLASLIEPTSMAPAASSEYSSVDPLFVKPEKIPGLETPLEEKPNPIPILGNINVNDLFAKLVATGIVSVINEQKPEIKDVKEDVKLKQKEERSVLHKVDLLKPETLRIKQPVIVAKLYGGMQCSGCGARFPPEHTVRYSQHLDWHFRQNRRERDSARRAHSRHWHYDLSDWVQYEEIEDLEEREKNWFETGGAEDESAPEAVEVGEAPSVAAGPPAGQHCALCGDAFDQFYNEDREEWHLRNSVQHDGSNYHPDCFEEYKASLTKDVPKDESMVELEDECKEAEPIEIKDVEDTDDSDNESVVEVVEPEQEPESVEIDEADDGDEDDVVLKAEPVEQVLVEDDVDTDDETNAERAKRDEKAAIDFANVKIKQEPIDPDDEPIITAEVEPVAAHAETTHMTVTSSIDGNVQLEDATPAPSLPFGGIRININKVSSLLNPQEDKMLEDVSADDEPLPPGEEPELEYKLKSQLEGVEFSRQPPMQKGNELSGLCSIM